jgi:hypothetical protein
MEAKKQRIIAYIIGSILLVVAIIAYAAFPRNAAEEQPLRIVFKSKAGNVLFDHKEHASEDGYALECTDCHHMMEEGETPVACGECHLSDDEEETPKRSDAFHYQCKGCHEDIDAGPVECSVCHFMKCSSKESQ